ncbi:MAG TPA: MBL fold metallo-hydrolase [Aurantimonas sp.]
MSDMLRLTVLGCASSPGVPRINGDWGACNPTNPRNRRTRSAALIERIGVAGRTVVAIDCGPDFHQQMLGAAVTRLDAVALTHPHADHIHGIDDLRGYMLAQQTRIPVYADAATHDRVLEAFHYCFETPPGSNYPPVARHVAITAGRSFEIDGPGGLLKLTPFRQEHGSIHSLGFRVGPLAYCSDVSNFPDEAIAAIAGARHIVIDALQYKPHPSHLTVAQALEWIDRFAVEGATLTHMHTPLDYDTLCRELPAHVRPGYDGLAIEFPLD